MPDRLSLAALALLAAVTASALPATARADKLTPERAFADPDITGPTARGVQISPDGRFVTFLRAKPDDQTVQDLWALPVAGGEARRLIDSTALEPKGQELSEAEKARRERQRISARGIVEYRWDEEGRQILVPAGGDLYLASAADGSVKRLTQTPGDETDAKFSRHGRYVGYVRDQNLYVNDLSGGGERALTRDGHGVISFGVAEFVAQEEMDRYTGYWFSPDETRIAYTRVDEGGVDVIPRLEINATGSTTVDQRYPRAGRPNAVVDLYVAGLTPGGAPVKVDLGLDPDIYLARVNWSEDGRTLYVQRQSRDQKTLELLLVDPATGASHVILTEHQEPWVDLNDNMTTLKDGTFIWGSQRTGWNHLYLYSREGRLMRAVTHGDGWSVVGAASGAGNQAPGIAYVDQERHLAYFVSGKDTPLERHLYVVSYAKPGEPRRITDGHGWWSISVAKDGRSFVGGYSDPATPPQTALYAMDGHRLQWIEENRLGPGHPYFPFLDHHVTPEFGTMKAQDGSTLHYALLKPHDFDPAERYPAIVEVYGGPHAEDVTRAWRGVNEQLYLGEGFVVFQIANRGGGGRGLQFAGALAGHLGGVEVEDQLTGLNWLKAQSYIDPKRIGVSGWSYGGYMTLRLLTEPRTGFRAGAAGAPPSDWRLYDTHYTEQFMGKPQDRDAAYTESAIIPRLDRLSGRLLLMQGMADDNVIFANSTAVMNRLQELSTPFDLMLFPGQRHGVRTNARKLLLWRTYLAFFKRELGGPQAR